MTDPTPEKHLPGGLKPIHLVLVLAFIFAGAAAALITGHRHSTHPAADDTSEMPAH